jgi:hypothetical protein
MTTNDLPRDLDDCPLWRLIVLLDDLEREQGAASPQAREVARAVAKRLGVISAPAPESVGEGVAHASR